MRISTVRCDSRRTAPTRRSDSVRSGTDFASSGSACRQLSIRVRSGWARVSSSVSDGVSRMAFSVLGGRESFMLGCFHGEEYAQGYLLELLEDIGGDSAERQLSQA